jgi:hypothetical protein
MIFLTATEVLVSWSFAELRGESGESVGDDQRGAKGFGRRGGFGLPDETERSHAYDRCLSVFALTKE